MGNQLSILGSETKGKQISNKENPKSKRNVTSQPPPIFTSDAPRKEMSEILFEKF